jgi:DNA-binding NarL/FixJ family response regulator
MPMKSETREVKQAVKKVRIALLDDHAMIRQSMRWTLERMGYSCVAEADNGKEFLALCAEQQPDMIITDLKLPDQSALPTIRALAETMPSVKILASSAAEHQRAFDEALEAGAHGYIHKASSVNLLQNAIETVLSGGKFLGSLPPGTAIEQQAHLAPREVDVLRLIAEGMSTKQVAAKLDISVRTADHYRTRLMQKLRVHDAVSLTRYALKAGIVSLD